MRSADTHPIRPCPYCTLPCEADWVDVGVGYVQCGPYHCEACSASEIGPYDEERELSADERRTGWYAPGNEPGSSANVIGGRVVTHRQMDAAYRSEFVGSPLHDVPLYVEAWRERLRKAGQ